MPKLSLGSREFRKTLIRYSSATERKIRDMNAARGAPATRRAANAFFRREMARFGRRFERAIDLGCNTGFFARAILASRCREMVLVDFSPKALARARVAFAPPTPALPRKGGGRRAARKYPAVSFLKADLVQDWKRISTLGRFDLVALCEVIQHVPDADARRRIFVHAARLVRPGGLFLFSHYARVRGEPAEGFFHSPHYPELLYYSCLSAREVAAWARAAGLSVVRRARTDPVNAFLMRKGKA